MNYCSSLLRIPKTLKMLDACVIVKAIHLCRMHNAWKEGKALNEDIRRFLTDGCFHTEQRDKLLSAVMAETKRS